MGKYDEEIIRLWPTHTQAEIARELGITSTHILYRSRFLRLGKNPNKYRGAGGAIGNTRKRVVELWDTQYPSQIARTIGVSRQRVEQIARAECLPSNNLRPSNRKLSGQLCIYCGKEIPRSKRGVASRREGHKECEEELSAGAVAYHMKVEYPHYTWSDLAELSGYSRAAGIIGQARKYALKRDLPWPLVWVWRDPRNSSKK